MERKLPEGWEKKNIGFLTEFEKKTGRSAKDGVQKDEKHIYKFFKSGEDKDVYSDNYDFDGEYLTVGDGGSANIHYINGKFGVSGHNFVFKSKEKDNKNLINNKLLYYSLFGSKDKWNKLYTGIGMTNISKTDFQNIDIFFPTSPTEQQKIVDYLDKQFAFIDNMEKEINEYESKLDELEKGILEEAFLDTDGNFTFNNEDYIKIIDGDRGNNYPKKDTFTKNGYCIFLSTSNIKKGKFDFSELEFITKEQDEKLRSGKLQNLDIVFTTRGTLGNTALYDKNNVSYENIRINSGMILLRVNLNKIYPKYFIYYLNSQEFKNQLNDFLSGGVIKQIPIRDLKNVKVNYIKDIQTQKSIAYKLDKQFELINSTRQEIEKQIKNLKELRKAMLNDIFGGFE